MFHFIFLLPVLKREKGGKGESGTSKTYFFTNFWISRIEKSYKKYPFPPLFPPFPLLFPLFPFEAGKEK